MKPRLHSRSLHPQATPPRRPLSPHPMPSHASTPPTLAAPESPSSERRGRTRRADTALSHPRTTTTATPAVYELRTTTAVWSGTALSTYVVTDAQGQVVAMMQVAPELATSLFRRGLQRILTRCAEAATSPLRLVSADASSATAHPSTPSALPARRADRVRRLVLPPRRAH